MSSAYNVNAYVNSHYYEEENDDSYVPFNEDDLNFLRSVRRERAAQKNHPPKKNKKRNK